MILTAKADIDSKIEGMSYGADAYIEKPFSIKFLKALARIFRWTFDAEKLFVSMSIGDQFSAFPFVLLVVPSFISRALLAFILNRAAEHLKANIFAFDEEREPK